MPEPDIDRKEFTTDSAATQKTPCRSFDYGLSAGLLLEQIARSGCWSRAHAQSASCHEVLRCRAALHAPVGWEIITALSDWRGYRRSRHHRKQGLRRWPAFADFQNGQ